jgi:pyruvate dehydrogenase E1 component
MMTRTFRSAWIKEGNIFEALLEGRKHDVRNLWWIIDYNRQSLDAVVSDRLFGRIDAMFEMMGWREHLQRDLNRHPGIRAILDDHDDAALQRLMTNPAGHDLDSVLAAFHAVEDDQPTCFIAYTIKGFGLPFAGHKDNHAGLMNLDQMETFRRSMEVAEGAEWALFAGLDLPPERLAEFVAGLPLAGSSPRVHDAAPVVVPPNLPVPRGVKLSTQEAFSRILGDIAAVFSAEWINPLSLPRRRCQSARDAGIVQSLRAQCLAIL